MTETKTLRSGRELVYDSIIYGLGAALAELAKTPEGAKQAEELHKNFGRHIYEYLTSRGVELERGEKPEEVVEHIVKTFIEKLEFAELELVEPTPDKGNRAVWRNLLGLQAYGELAKRYPDPFLACPLNAVIRHILEKKGHTLIVHGCRTDLNNNILESWEEITQGKRFLTP
ncbi:MAG TPA: hypothetical protein EYH45_06940 [Candidatus Caldiarchaeum subterraneum]|uniref:Uncharacterized protein n=1 Tax=Caldiarchaeum subterraneum TaxID=311458 RepID=A0A832ZWY3_CALS0|nr:hypothetical protein [Aigarchaeota archaeon]HIQ30283.1 hypothetical protein [Candidatus Caldarchaeum subterraneum]